jgi:hypothetical protein
LLLFVGVHLLLRTVHTHTGVLATACVRLRCMTAYVFRVLTVSVQRQSNGERWTVRPLTCRPAEPRAAGLTKRQTAENEHGRANPVDSSISWCVRRRVCHRPRARCRPRSRGARLENDAGSRCEVFRRLIAVRVPSFAARRRHRTSVGRRCSAALISHSRRST